MLKDPGCLKFAFSGLSFHLFWRNSKSFHCQLFSTSLPWDVPDICFWYVRWSFKDIDFGTCAGVPHLSQGQGATEHRTPTCGWLIWSLAGACLWQPLGVPSLDIGIVLLGTSFGTEHGAKKHLRSFLTSNLPSPNGQTHSLIEVII